MLRMTGKMVSFNLGFFVHHVFANLRVEFFDLDFLGMQPLVFCRRVEMSGAGRRNQSYLVAHSYVLLILRQPSDFLAALSQIGDHFFDTEFVDDSHTFRRNL